MLTPQTLNSFNFEITFLGRDDVWATSPSLGPGPRPHAVITAHTVHHAVWPCLHHAVSMHFALSKQFKTRNFDAVHAAIETAITLHHTCGMVWPAPVHQSNQSVTVTMMETASLIQGSN